MSRRLSFGARLMPRAERLPWRSASMAIVLIVALSWVVCVGGAWVIAGAGVSWAGAWIALRGDLRRAREASGLRQVDVASHLRMSVRHFARIESGEIDPQSRILFA